MKTNPMMNKKQELFATTFLIPGWALVYYAVCFMPHADLTFKVIVISSFILMLFGTLVQLERLKEVFNLNIPSITPIKNISQKQYQSFGIFMLGMSYGFLFFAMIGMGWAIELLFITTVWILGFLLSFFLSKKIENAK